MTNLASTASSATARPFKKRNREESTRRILQAGLDVFSKVGYDAATTKMIAQQSGLNESLIQRYFQSKHNLLIEVIQLSFEAMHNESPYPPADTPREEILRFLLHKLQVDAQRIDFSRVILSRLMVDPKLRTDLEKQKKTDLMQFFRKRLEAFQNKGMIRADIQINLLIETIFSYSMSIGVLDRILFDRSLEDCKKHFQLFSDCLTRGIQCEPASKRSRIR
jgi:AcrR family transcriptional regulator